MVSRFAGSARHLSALLDDSATVLTMSEPADRSSFDPEAVSGSLVGGVAASASSGEFDWSAAAVEGSSSGRWLWWVFTAAVVVGVAVGFWLAASGSECVDLGLSPVECSSSAAYAQVLASRPLPSGEDRLLVAAVACPAATGEVAVRGGELLCLGAVSGVSWLTVDPPAPGDCVVLPGGGPLGPPQVVSCPAVPDGLVALVVGSHRLAAPGPSPVLELLELYGRQVEFACEVGSPLGPSFFEWRGGADTLICVVAVSGSPVYGD